MNSPWLERADRIGHRLIASAIREGGRCVWLGRSKKEATPTGAIVPTVEPLGPELYDGTAGVALFLGRLHLETGDPTAKRRAHEAIEHSLTEHARSESFFGLYSGFSGIAWAAAHLAVWLDEPALASRAQKMLLGVTNAPIEGAPSDIMAGIAGTAVALLAWPEALRAADEVESLVRLGTALSDAATRRNDMWAWKNTASPPLTGLSHGAAGMGVVLLEIHRRTGIDRFLEIGRGAFGYEDCYFDTARKNWPDFRPDTSWSSSSQEQAFGHGWCNGAPGIALARRHALSIHDDPVWQRDWEMALDTCRHAARDLFLPGTDVTLCHGLAGCVEPLLEAGRRDEVGASWQPLIEQFSETNTWPSGMPSHGPNPSLMLGTAGIGYTFLRMHDPKTPSVLLPLIGSER